ncbi:hypothetical protein DL96DRAFT_1582833, partial [Flagelloscypha sp. PMI_526]
MSFRVLFWGDHACARKQPTLGAIKIRSGAACCLTLTFILSPVFFLLSSALPTTYPQDMDSHRAGMSNVTMSSQPNLHHTLPPGNHYPDTAGQVPHPAYSSVSFMKGPKRKRLTKACDGCHRSKRRCDGTGNAWTCKPCSYTDQAGRRVPAPNANPKNVTAKPAYHVEEHSPRSAQTSGHVGPAPPPPPRYSTEMPPPSQPFTSPSSEPQYPPSSSSSPPPPPQESSSQETSHQFSQRSFGRFHHELWRADPFILVFFAHCHLARCIIHKPVFSNALTQNRVPKYLIFAMCAVAAPFSRQDKVRTDPPRLAGTPFSQEAKGLLFNGAGRLVQEPSLATAQALCLLQLYEMVANEALLFHVIHTLGVMNPDPARLTPQPTPEYIDRQMQLECLRRIFCKPLSTGPKDSRLTLKLPLSETTFELAVTNILPEFLHLDPVKAPYSSEFGHLVRILTIYNSIERGLRDPDEHARTIELSACAEKLRKWQNCLSEELEYKQDRAEVQTTMLDTSSSSGAWCYFHFHASLYRSHRPTQSREATTRLLDIVDRLGERSRYSLIPASAAWAILRHGRQDDPRIHGWCLDLRNHFGLDIRRLASTTSPAQRSPTHASSSTASTSRAHSSIWSTAGHLPSPSSSSSLRPRRESEYVSDSTSTSSRGGTQSPAFMPQSVTNGRSNGESLTLPREEEGRTSRSSSASSSSTHLPSLKASGLLAWIGLSTVHGVPPPFSKTSAFTLPAFTL